MKGTPKEPETTTRGDQSVDEDGTDELDVLALLAEPMRRRLYRHVVGQPGPVSRDGAATAMGVPRSVVAFHLDKLAESGLLDVEYRRPEGRRGPGAGRPAKFYRRGSRQVTLSVPARRYEVAATILADAIEGFDVPESVSAQAVDRASRRYGQRIASALGHSRLRSTKRSLSRIAALLASEGYEPTVEGTMITLANCPFAAIADKHRDLVCHMNLALVQGVLDSTGTSHLEARLDPHPGRCCVAVGRSSP